MKNGCIKCCDRQLLGGCGGVCRTLIGYAEKKERGGEVVSSKVVWPETTGAGVRRGGPGGVDCPVALQCKPVVRWATVGSGGLQQLVSQVWQSVIRTV